MFGRRGKISYGLRCGLLLLCLGFVAGQTLAQEHLHLDGDASATCAVCASGDTSPLGELGAQTARPGFVLGEIVAAPSARRPLSQFVAAYSTRAPPYNA